MREMRRPDLPRRLRQLFLLLPVICNIFALIQPHATSQELYLFLARFVHGALLHITRLKFTSYWNFEKLPCAGIPRPWVFMQIWDRQKRKSDSILDSVARSKSGGVFTGAIIVSRVLGKRSFLVSQNVSSVTRKTKDPNKYRNPANGNVKK